MSTFDSIQDRFERSMFIVIGYMHDNGETEFLVDLIKVITTYYHRLDEWCSIYRGKNMKILEGSNNTIFCKTVLWTHECILGTEIISGGRYKWKIRVNKLYYKPNFWHIYTGVINMNKANINFKGENQYVESIGCYTFDTTKGRVVNQSNRSLCFETKVTKPGDIIDITLDLEEKSVRCKVNGTDVGESIKKIEKGQYRLLVSLYFYKTELELL